MKSIVGRWSLLVLLLPWSLVAQAPAGSDSFPGPEAIRQRAGQVMVADSTDPVELLLSYSRELRLSPDQIIELRAIQEWLEGINQPLVARLLEVQRLVLSERMDAAGPSGLVWPRRTHLEIGRAPLRRIQENNRAAMNSVSRVLTRNQKRRASRLLEPNDSPRSWGLPGVWRGPGRR